MATTNAQLQWHANFHFRVLVSEVQVIVEKARLYPGFYSIDHLDHLVAMEPALWINNLRLGNLRYGHIYTSVRATLTRISTRQFYRTMTPYHQERVNLLAQLLQNDCIPLSLKYEIVTNLPRLVSVEEPTLYH